MKKVALWGGVIFVLILALALFMASKFGEKSQLYAAGQISIDSSLEQDASGLRILFISVYDMDSQMPMPYGAVRERLSTDAKGEFFEFFLTKESLRVMNPNAPLPKRLKIKARIDVDGVGGPAQSGDLLGEAQNISLGSKGVRIVINNKI